MGVDDVDQTVQEGYVTHPASKTAMICEAGVSWEHAAVSSGPEIWPRAKFPGGRVLHREFFNSLPV